MLERSWERLLGGDAQQVLENASCLRRMIFKGGWYSQLSTLVLVPECFSESTGPRCIRVGKKVTHLFLESRPLGLTPIGARSTRRRGGED